jgi:hypothetical protein
VVSINPITGSNQNFDTYWARVKCAFDERKLVDPEFNTMHMDRNESGMSHRWGIIQHACNKFHGVVEEIRKRTDSGKNVTDLVSSSSFNLSSFGMPQLVQCVLFSFVVG